MYWRLIAGVLVWLGSAGLAAAADDAMALYDTSQAELRAGRPDAAISALRKAAALGHAPAQNALGFALQHGSGLPRDPAAALAWFRRAAEQGLADAEFNLGFMLQRGEAGSIDITQAADWFHRAADHGSAPAIAALGTLYADGPGAGGNGPARDSTLALLYLTRAAEAGEPNAANRLGVI